MRWLCVVCGVCGMQDGYYFYRFTEKKKVVIVGGGFAGSKVAKKLQAAFDVTLVDSKDHFVCLISLPSCVCDTAHLSKVTSRHSTVCTLRAPPNSATTLRRALWVADDCRLSVRSISTARWWWTR